MAETKANEARASYETVLAEEVLVESLITKTSLSEVEFLKIVKFGRQSELNIGTIITLPNGRGTTNQWLVADVNHDDTTGTVDLVSRRLIRDKTSEAYTTNNSYWGSSQLYADSTIRNWLTETYINGFSTAIQNVLKTMNVVVSDKNGYPASTNDKIKLLSLVELGYDNIAVSGKPSSEEGTRYPIFNTFSDRIRYEATGDLGEYWTRTRDTSASTYVFYIENDGSCASTVCQNTTVGIVPVIRF